jgi:hypothetical protein
MRHIRPSLSDAIGGRLPWARCGLLVSLMLASAPAPLPGQGAVHLTLRAQASLDSLREPSAIVDAAEDANGNVFILDASSIVTMVDRHLRLLGTFGRLPSGAMAFRNPVSIGTLGDGRVAVLDEARQTISVMRPELGGRRLALVDTVAVRPFARGMCVLRDNTFLVYGASGGMRLHVYSTSGRLLRSFAPADPTQSAGVQDQFAMGRLGCSQARDEVLLTSAFLPTVEAYRVSSGQRIWVDSLRPYRAATVTIRSRGMSIRTPPAGHSVAVSAVILDGCRLLQAKYLGRQDGGSEDTVVSYLFRDTGRTGASVQLDVPTLVPLRNNKVLSLPATQPVIQLQEVRVDGCGVAASSRSARP